MGNEPLRWIINSSSLDCGVPDSAPRTAVSGVEYSTHEQLYIIYVPYFKLED
jgi:hypothetical protein